MAAATLAGCLGDGDEESDTSNGGVSNGDIDEDAWPDLSGQSVQYITDEGSPEAQEFYNQLAAEFTQATGAQVNIEYTGHGLASDQRVIQLIQAGDPPEVYLADQSMAATFGNEGVLEPVDDLVGEFSDRWGDPVSGRAVIDDTDYAIPKHVDYGTFWYRSDVSDIVPDTWDSVIEYCQDVEENTDLNGMYQPAGIGHHQVMHTLSWAWQNEARLVEAQNGGWECVMNEGDNRNRWIETLEQFKRNYEYSPTTTDSDWGPMITAIGTETNAANWYGGARPKGEREVPGGAAFGQDIELVPGGMPSPEGRSGPLRDGGNSLVIFAGADTEAARTFIEFFYESERYLQHFFEVDPVTINPPYPEIRDSDEYWENILEYSHDMWTEDQLEAYVIDAAENIQSFPNETSPPNPFAGSIVTEQLVDQMVQDALVDDEDPSELVDEYTPRINQIMDDPDL